MELIDLNDSETEAKCKAMEILVEKANSEGEVGLLDCSNFYGGTNNPKNRGRFINLLEKLKEEGFIESYVFDDKNRAIINSLKIDKAWYKTIKNPNEV